MNIAIAEPSFWKYLGLLGLKPSINITKDYGKILTPNWELFQKPLKCNFPGYCKRSYGKPPIKAVISLEARGPAQCEDGHQLSDSLPTSPGSVPQTLDIEASSQMSEELDEKEKLRRMRISAANTGKLPWNKGRKHNPETVQRIRERTKLAMQNPKVRLKLQKAGHAQSKETKTKIAIGVRMVFQRRRERLKTQETCFFEWQNLIAEAARGGFADEVELQWNSYGIMNKQLEKEWLENIKNRKMAPQPNESKRAPKSLEQRKKIAAAVAAKWADPEYRKRVCAGMAKCLRKISAEENKVRRKPSSQLGPKRYSKKKVEDSEKSLESIRKRKSEQPVTKKSKAPSYKDPLVLSKLDMIKNIRAQRVASEMKRHEAFEQAKLLIAEAEKAAKVLEAAATSSPIARSSLIETKKLIAEAVQSIQSIENGQFFTNEPSSTQRTFPESEMAENFAYESSGTHQEQVNGINGQESRQIDRINFDLYMQDSINGRNYYLPPSFRSSELPATGKTHSPSKRPLDQPEVNGNAKGNGNSMPNETQSPTGTGKVSPASETKTKKWFRGRLVDVPEGK